MLNKLTCIAGHFLQFHKFQTFYCFVLFPFLTICILRCRPTRIFVGFWIHGLKLTWKSTKINSSENFTLKKIVKKKKFPLYSKWSSRSSHICSVVGFIAITIRLTPIHHDQCFCSYHTVYFLVIMTIIVIKHPMYLQFRLVYCNSGAIFCTCKFSCSFLLPVCMLAFPEIRCTIPQEDPESSWCMWFKLCFVCLFVFFVFVCLFCFVLFCFCFCFFL